MILALKELNVELDYDRWIEVFEKVYQGVLIDHLTYIKKAEEVAGGAIFLEKLDVPYLNDGGYFAFWYEEG